jgi:Endoplasmic Reticulum-Golgi Intermediate Compartment (ERGIC)
MGEGIKSFDFYRYTPTKFLEQTISGAIISLCVVGFGIWLAMHEWNVIFNDKLKSEMVFDNLHLSDLQVKMDITLLNVPCDIVDLRFTSKKGKDHSV